MNSFWRTRLTLESSHIGGFWDELVRDEDEVDGHTGENDGTSDA